MNWLDHLKAARRVSVPIVAINTPDPAATIQAVSTAINGESAKVEWDVVRGLTGLNELGAAAVAQVCGEFDETKSNPTMAFVKAAELPRDSVLFVHLASRWIQEPPVIQALWNLRDRFKRNRRTCVLLSRQLSVPLELQDDVIVIDEPLPDEQQLTGIVEQQHKNAGLEIDGASGQAESAVRAIRGLSAFSAEQVTAMCLRKSGLDLDSLWERKRQAIEQTPGLKVYRDGGTFAGIGGCRVVKEFLTRIMHGATAPNAIVFIDEIEKAMAGRGDTSGVSQDQLGAILSYMQDHACAGMIFVGPPGAAKSAVAKAAGQETGVPTIQLDLGAAKGSLVGQSEQQLRAALKVITAVSNGQSLWIATCNSIGELPPELRRRFTLGTFFFDLPTPAERSDIWSLYRQGFSLSLAQKEGRVPDDGWTGAEIKQCCDIAYRLGCSLRDAAEFVVPVSRSAADAIKRLRDQADGRFLSASHPGVYRTNKATSDNSGRAFTLED